VRSESSPSFGSFLCSPPRHIGSSPGDSEIDEGIINVMSDRLNYIDRPLGSGNYIEESAFCALLDENKPEVSEETSIQRDSACQGHAHSAPH